MKLRYLILMASLALFAKNAYADTCPTNTSGCYSGYICSCNSDGKLMEKIDSYGTSKYTYTYDANGNQISQTYYEGNIPKWQDRYTYDANRNQISSTFYEGADNIEYNRANSQWRYTYDANGNRTSETGYYGADNIASENPTPSSQRRYTYDANGDRTSRTLYEGASNIEYNTPTEQDRYTYDANRNPTSSTHYEGASNIEYNIPDSQQCDTYDANGNWTSWAEYDCSTDVCESVSAPDLTIICVTGYVKGCVGAEITLPNGTSAIMKSGEIFSNSSDGSVTLYNEDGSIKGFKGKRIYTPAEAAAVVKPEGNTFKLRYR